MQVEETNIDGLYVVKYFSFSDVRGQLIKPFVFDKFVAEGLSGSFKEIWFTKSKKDVIRAMHMQVGELACNKFITVVQGKITDIILDLRKESSSYGEVFDIELDENSKVGLYIPIGCAHGYRVHTENTIVMYAADQQHSAKDDVGVRWDSFGYNWQCDDPIVSDRDKQLIAFQDY